MAGPQPPLAAVPPDDDDDGPPPGAEINAPSAPVRLQRAPRGAPAAEQELLAICLIDASVHDRVFELLVEADFSHPACQAVFAQMHQMWDSGSAVSRPLLEQKLMEAGQLERVAAQGLLDQMGAVLPTTPPDTLIRIIQDWSVRRRATVAAAAIAKMANDPQIPVSDLVSQAQALGTEVELPDQAGKAQPVAQMILGDADPDWVIPGLLEVQDRVIVVAPEGKGKALALDTEVAMADGSFVPIEHVQVGDKVLGPGDEPRVVMAKSEVMSDRNCIMLHWSNGESVVADYDHQWLTYHHCDWRVNNTIHLAEIFHTRRSFTDPVVWLPDPTNITKRGAHLIGAEAVPQEPVQCLQVDHPDGLFQIGRQGVLTHNSTLLRQFAVMTAAGLHPFTGSRLEQPLRTLIVDLENRENQIRRRLMPLVAQASYTTGSEDWATERCFVYSRPEGIDVRSRNDLGELIATVRQVRPQLVTIGPLYKMALGDPTDEEVAKSIAGVLDRLTVRFGCAMMIEAHAPHGDSRGGRREMRVYGASLWQRWPDFGIGLYPESDGGMIVEHWRGAREEREWPSHLARGRAWPWIVQVDDSGLADDDQGQEF